MTSNIRETMAQGVPEGGECELTFQIVDGAGVQVPLASLLTLTLTLYDEATGASIGGPVINSRSAQSIKNANGCTVTEAAGVTTAVLKLAGLDHPIVTVGKRTEWHICFFEWTWVGGVGPGRKEIAFRVTNLSRI